MTVARSHALEPHPLLQTLLVQARAAHASDVHLRSAQQPWMRVNGAMQPLLPNRTQPHDTPTRDAALTHAQLHEALQATLGNDAWTQLQRDKEVDTAWSWPSLGRYRVNAFACETGWGLVLRCIADQVPPLATLHAPSALTGLLQGSGLVLVTGPTGSGKSTTLAAMLAHLNAHRALHVLTLEDPIEFLHRSDRCLITQREIGRDSHAFAMALRAALREDPDVLLVGEMRDLDTIRLALTAAETGHLVLASLHSRHAAAAVDRILDVFEAAEKALIRTQLAESLRGVLAQHLVPRADGTGRCALYELLMVTPAVRHLIREGKTAQIASAMQTGAAHGMVTMAQSRLEAERAGRIATRADAASET